MSRESIYKRYTPAVAPEEGNDDCGYWFVFRSGKLLTDTGRRDIPYLRSLDELGLSPLRMQYLGTLQGHPCYSAEIPPDTDAPEGTDFKGLLSLYGALDEDVFILAGKASQIVRWDQTHQYCGRCGHRTETLKNERARKCPSCGFTSYPRLSPAVITAVTDGDKILLAHYAAFSGDMHTIIAGFVEPGETLEECVRREVLEEVGVGIKNIRYFGSQPWPFPNSLMIGFTAEYESGEITADGKEISRAGWFDANNLPELPPNVSIARDIIDSVLRKISSGG